MFIFMTYPELVEARNGVWSVSEEWVKKKPHKKVPVK
jgi:hypothetical protein